MGRPPDTLPPPCEWPTARMIRKDRIAGVLLLLVLFVPCAVAFVHLVRGEREGPAAFLLTFGMLPASAGFVVHALLDRRGRGLVMRAVRGGPQAIIEVRARSGVGGGLALPVGDALATQRVYRVGQKRLVVADASVPTAAGTVIFARGGTTLDPELVRWFEAVAASEGSSEAGPPGATDPPGTTSSV